jgi:hypothetical protein
MSDARRKRKQELTVESRKGPLSRERLIWLGIAAVITLSYGAFWYHNNHRYDAFAKCLTAKQAKMYGAYWCPHCAEQKEEFGASFKYVNYVECAIRGSRDLTPACTAANVQHFPSWQFGDGPLVENVFPLEELSDKTGCSLP